jgi:hypothetical protein
MIQNEGLYVYKMHDIEEKLSIAHLRSRGGSLVSRIKYKWYVYISTDFLPDIQLVSCGVWDKIKE